LEKFDAGGARFGGTVSAAMAKALRAADFFRLETGAVGSFAAAKKSVPDPFGPSHSGSHPPSEEFFPAKICLLAEDSPIFASAIGRKAFVDKPVR
jgi:hypothetical protein